MVLWESYWYFGLLLYGSEANKFGAFVGAVFKTIHHAMDIIVSTTASVDIILYDVDASCELKKRYFNLVVRIFSDIW